MNYLICALMITLSVGVVFCENFNKSASECGVQLGQWPWHASIFIKTLETKRYVCSGTLISASAVLTSAQCVLNKTTNKKIAREKISIKIGSIHLKSSKNETSFDVRRIYIHYKYTSSSHMHDLAILILGNSPDTTRLTPACLNSPDFDQEKPAMNRTVVGWGLSNQSVAKKNMKTTTLSVLKNSDCVNNRPDIFSRDLFEDNRMFCAAMEKGSGICNGNLGGGIFYKENNKWYVVGIVSYAPVKVGDLCDTNNYTAFTNLNKYPDWIDNKMNQRTTSQSRCVKFKKSLQPTSNVSHMALLGFGSENEQYWFCAGTIISRLFILSSKLCHRFISSKLGLQLNIVRLMQTNKILPVRRLHFHPNATDTENNFYDGMLVELAEPISFNETVPACLESVDEVMENEGNLYTVDLNGRIKGNEQSLSFRKISVLSNITCAKSLSVVAMNSTLKAHQICIRNPDDFPTLFMFGSNQVMRKVGDFFHILAIKSTQIPPRANTTASYTIIKQDLKWMEDTVWRSKQVDLRFSEDK